MVSRAGRRAGDAMSPRAAHMDHAHYDFSPIVDRPKLTWPGGKNLALTVFLYLEHWDLDKPDDGIQDPRLGDPFGSFSPDYRAYTIRQYGLRVGIFRIMQALDQAGMKVTVAANAKAATKYPNLMREFVKRGYEIAAHGMSAREMVSSAMSPDRERTHIEACLAAVESAAGTRPRGWIAQDYGESAITPEILSKLGLLYLADWANDDRPYRMKHRQPIVSLPNQADLDDVQLLWLRRLLTQDYPRVFLSAVETLEAEHGRFLGLHLHPWLFGMPHRIRYLEELLEALSSRGTIWRATACEVADAFLAQGGA